MHLKTCQNEEKGNHTQTHSFFKEIILKLIEWQIVDISEHHERNTVERYCALFLVLFFTVQIFPVN